MVSRGQTHECRQYYYDEETGGSNWDMPLDIDAIDVGEDSSEWEAHVDDSTGRTYYANKMCVFVSMF